VFVIFIFYIFESFIEQVISYTISFSSHHFFECTLFDFFFIIFIGVKH
jgi:hypothetical protein